MKKLSCDIIRDLIPSYLDLICSDASKKAVEEHLTECKDCRAYMDALKHTELFTEKSDGSGLDFMKKVKQYYARKNALGALLLFGPVIIILPVITTLHLNFENELYHVLFTVLALGACLLLSDYKTKPKNHWPAILSVTAGVLGVLCATVLMAVLYRCLKTETGIFGKALSESGRFFNTGFLMIVVLELLVFAGCAVNSVRKEYAFGILPALNLTCCSLCMSYRSILFYMDGTETILKAILQDIRAFLLLTAGVMLAETALLKIRRYFERKTLGDL